MAGGAPNLKMIYFPVQGRGEYIRYLCLIAGVPLEEETVNFQDWPQRKPTTPFGGLPLLEVNGKTLIAQSLAIGRYLAKLFNMNGKDALEQALCDMYVEGCDELYTSFSPIAVAIFKYADQPDMKEKAIREYEEALNKYLDRYEKFLANNPSGWLVGDKMTWADVFVAEFMGRSRLTVGNQVLENHPNVKALVKRVHEIPAIAERVKTRPVDPLSNRGSLW